MTNRSPVRTKTVAERYGDRVELTAAANEAAATKGIDTVAVDCKGRNGKMAGGDDMGAAEWQPNGLRRVAAKMEVLLAVSIEHMTRAECIRSGGGVDRIIEESNGCGINGDNEEAMGDAVVMDWKCRDEGGSDVRSTIAIGHARSVKSRKVTRSRLGAGSQRLTVAGMKAVDEDCGRNEGC